MELSEFKSSIVLLRGAYGDRVFPKEREMVLWRRYEHCRDGAFKSAVDLILLRMPQPHAVIEWLDDKLETAQAPTAFGPVHQCPPCRDFGYGFNGDTVVACSSCARGRRIGPDELAHHQKAYNAGAKFMAKGGGSPFPELPYDPRKRVGT